MFESRKLISLIKHLIWGKPKRVVSVPSIWDGPVFQRGFDEGNLRFHGIFTCTVDEYDIRLDMKKLVRLGWDTECMLFITYYEEKKWGFDGRDHELSAVMAAVGKGSIRLYGHITELEKGEGIGA